MVSAERQQIMETNRSLRTIKNELETLLEKGAISDDVFESIHALLPAEAPLSGAVRASASTTPSLASRSVGQTTSPSTPPTNALSNLALDVSPPSNPPPSYNQTGPPSLPARNQPPPPPAPTRPVLAHARALYPYAASDARDVSFEKDDRIAVHEYMNADWWMGRNERTGGEGIFPKTYVLVEPENKGHGQAQNVYAPGPSAPSNPYNSSVPPMAVAEGGGQKGSGMEGAGKKFGKKLGNAAIFGAGATIGSNIVNSIF